MKFNRENQAPTIPHLMTYMQISPSIPSDSVHVHIRKTPLGAYVLMLKYAENCPLIGQYLEDNYVPILSKLAREPKTIYGTSQEEAGKKFLWMSWFFEAPSVLKAVIKHMQHVPITTCECSFEFKISSFTSDIVV